ncbi:DUF2066 domain-containing protein [Alkalisalibacterium limincola]|uniref:DUF2066 domain-containing protein n=1 Tax=Alkalisalibacterium limincola TaxID=2699169 RepID=A0A5C8KYF1_9GAMM|nr:DUF2066 domain-containing protein [Alkalisalibacterium limincola]
MAGPRGPGGCGDGPGGCPGGRGGRGDVALPTGPAEWADGPRPTPGLWLVIDDGRGPRLVVSRQRNAVAPLVQAAGNQGLVLRLPEGGTQDDRQGLEAAWESNDATTRQIAGRYGSGELVLGRLSRVGAGWEAQWRVVDSLGEAEAFSRSGAMRWPCSARWATSRPATSRSARRTCFRPAPRASVKWCSRTSAPPRTSSVCAPTSTASRWSAASSPSAPRATSSGSGFRWPPGSTASTR